MRTDVPLYARQWFLANPLAPPTAAPFDVRPQTKKVWRSRLVRAGTLPRLRQPVRLDAAREIVADGHTLVAAAARLKVSERGLRSALRRRGMRRDDLAGPDEVLSGRGLAALFGVSHSTAQRWLNTWHGTGLIEATPPIARGGLWRVTAVALMAFLEHPDCPLDPTRITDPAWRAYAVAARAGHLKPPAPHEEKPRPTRECVECGRPKSRKGVRCKGCATKKEVGHAPR